MTPRITAIFLGLVLTALPSAARAEGFEKLVQETIVGEGWVAYAVEPNGADVNLLTTTVGGTFPAHAGAYLYASTGRLVIGVTNTALSGNTGVYIDAHPAPGADLNVDRRDPKLAGGAPAAGVGINGAHPAARGIIYLVAWSAGNHERTDIQLEATPGARLVTDDTSGDPLIERGNEAYLFTTEDFSGAAHLEAGGSVPPFRSAVRATALTKVSLNIKNTFVGVYNVGFASPVPGAPAGFPIQVNQMSAQDPNGTRDCPCVWTSFIPDDFGPPGGPGSYTFHNSGVGVLGGGGDVFVGGADVRLPALPA